ncbi:MAG: CCA tRNA nucleotidyltransferase [Alphaproteobacteria bacterium HGW-Alphaproteobacteria-2]|nr:MAG: CCA tRNA nucleotidyltransferase [Alphaproteobacteria bacterium HGW-Alphaproteobacteria-2]
MTRVAGAWLEAEGTQAVLGALARAGHKALAVGGCVRNALLGQPVADVDIATDAPPDRVIEIARDAGLKAVPTGIEHGTVTLVAGGRGFEVTTFRRDVETDGRRAVVAFTDLLEEDAARRDFTMNALYAEADGRVIDPLAGLADLRARRVRFVGRAEDRIREDYLRILRFFRFHAWYGDAAAGPEPEGLAACARLAGGIAGLSRERLGAEMRKLLAAPDPAQSVAAMAHAGVLAAVLPGARNDAGAALVRLVAAERAAGAAPGWPRRLAVLGDPEAAALLRLSRAQAVRQATIGAALAAAAPAAATAWRHGTEAARDAALLRAAETGRPLPAGLEAEMARGAAARPPVAARDLPGLEGPTLGAALRAIEAEWLASDLHATRAELLARHHARHG